MKKSFTILYFLFFAFHLYSQCPTGDLLFETQQEIDNFLINYPNCTAIDGDVDISPPLENEADITNLNGLQNITSISGSLTIYNSNISDFNGLQNLNHVGGSLSISLLDVLQNFKGLENLTSVGSLSIYLNYPTAITFDINTPIFNALAGEVSYIRITIKNSTGELTGFNNITSVGYMVLEDNGGFDFINVFENLQTIHQDLFFHDNATEHISGFSNLYSIGRNFEIFGYSSFALPTQLNTLSGFENLYSIGEYLSISHNSYLQELPLFENLYTLKQLVFSFNSYMTLPNDSSTNLLSGFNTLNNIENISISYNSRLESINGFANLQTIKYSLSIRNNSSLKNINSLNNLNTVWGGISINTNAELEHINGFNALTSQASMSITYNSSLKTILGFENLASINELYLNFNDELDDISGFQNLSTISNELSVQNNPLLSDCSSLCNSIANPPAVVSLSANLTACNTINELEASCICVPPVNITTQIISGNVLRFFWEQESLMSTYNFRYRALGSNSWIEVASIDPFYSLNLLLPNTTYEYQLQSNCDPYGLSAWTAITNITTGSELCDRPENITVTELNANEVEVAWDFVANASKYKVSYAPANSDVYTTINLENVNSFIVSGLSPYRDYNFRVKAKCTNGWTNWTEPISFAINTPGYCPYPNFTTDILSGNVVRLSWPAISDFKKVKIRYRVANDSQPWIDIESKFNFCFINGLQTLTRYEFQIKTICTSNASIWSPVYNFTTSILECDRPIVSAYAVNWNNLNYIRLDWDEVIGATKYKITWKCCGTSTSETIGSTDDFAIYDYVPGEQYKITIKAKCFGGWTNNSLPYYVDTPPAFSENNQTRLSKESTINIAPNPFNDYFKLNWSSSEKARVHLFNNVGQLISSFNSIESGHQFDLSKMESGIYILKVEIDGLATTHRVVKL